MIYSNKFMVNKKSSKLKWCFLINMAPMTVDFLALLAHQVVEAGDECIIVVNSKITEYSKKKYFPEKVKIISEVDWCIANYEKNQKEFQDLSWKEFFPEFDRFNRFKLYDYNYHNSVEIVAQSYQFADFVLKEERPDIVISEPPTGIFNGIFYFFCKRYKINYLGVLASRIKDKFDFYDLNYTYSGYEKTFKKLSITDISEKEKKFAKEFIKDFVSHKYLSSYMTYHYKHKSLSQISKVRGYIKREKEIVYHYLRYLLKRKYFYSFDYYGEFFKKYIFLYPLKSLRNKFRALLQKNIFCSLVDNDKFFIYPLHLQPEASTSVRAMYFCDQLNTIKNIAFSLPFPYKLYVKEHPKAFGTRSWHFYKKIKEIPNVILVSPREGVENLIKKSRGAVVLTSTVGLEAILSGKPAYALGKPFYLYHPLCRKVNSFEELGQAIQKDLISRPAINNLEDINTRFVVSYLRNTITGDIITAGGENDTNNYKAIYKDIVKIFFKDKN